MSKTSISSFHLLLKHLRKHLLFLLIPLSSFGQINFDKADSLSLTFNNYVANHLQEKIYVVTDKPFYALTDTIWFQTFLTNAVTHQTSPLSTTVYVDLLDSQGSTLETKILLSKNGLAPGSFTLSDKWKPGHYMLQSYTRWMLNFGEEFLFRKKIEVLPIWPKHDNQAEDTLTISDQEPHRSQKTNEPKMEIITLDFYPEGGNLVANAPTVIGVKSRKNGTEKGIQLKGRLLAENGNLAATFQCNEYGIGAFILPNPNGVYIIQLDDLDYSVEYTFPEIVPKGVSMKVLHQFNSNDVRLYLKSTLDEGLNNGRIIGHSRGRMFCNVSLASDSLLSQRIVKISKDIIPAGVAHFTFLDARGVPQSERLMYRHDESAWLKGEIHLNKASSKKREKVSFAIQMEEAEEANVTVSVSNATAVTRNVNDETIGSYLLLSSDVNGQVQDPGFYLNDFNPAKYRQLDFLMLTHGWRRFKWDDILGDSDKNYNLPERGITFSGALKNFTFRKKPEKGIIQLLSYTHGLTFIEKETNDDGRFRFDNIVFNDSVDFFLQAKKKKEGSNRYYIELDKMAVPKVNPFEEVAGVDQATSELFIEMSNKQYLIEQNYSDKVIILDELQIIEKAVDPFEEISINYGTPDYRMVTDSLLSVPASLYSMLLQVPSVYVSTGTITIRNQTASLFIDGDEVDSSSFEPIIQSTPGSDIYFIDVDRNGFSSNRGRPSVYVYTKSGNGISSVDIGPIPGILNYAHPGYHRAREFYQPNYDPDQPKTAKPDYRLQLYWNPQLNLSSGQGEVSFYTGDDRTTYDIIIEGLSTSGRAIYEKTQFTVE